MRILLISTNRCREIMPCMPLAVACLSGVLPEHDVQVLDLFLEENPEEAIRKAVRNIQPGLVGLSVRNIDNQLWSRTEFYLPAVKRYVELIREETEMPTVVGGAGYNIYPYDALNYLEADWGIVGDGEVTFPLFINAVENCRDPSSIPGVIKRGAAGERSVLPRVEDYDKIPLPAFDVIRLKDYTNQGGSLSILARRGCPYECIYCDAPVSEGHVVKGKSPQRLVDEIEAANHKGVAGFFIADNVFNYPKGYAPAVAEEIIRRKLKIAWGATLHPRGIDEDDVRLMRRAGFVAASAGPDSGSPQMIRRLGKGFTVEEISYLFRLLKENDIHFFTNFLLGGPGESKSTIEESIKLALSAKADLTNFRVGIRITPQTEIHKIAVREGSIAPTDNLLEPRFYINNDLRDWALDFLHENLGGIPRFVVQ